MPRSPDTRIRLARTEDGRVDASTIAIVACALFPLVTARLGGGSLEIVARLLVCLTPESASLYHTCEFRR